MVLCNTTSSSIDNGSLVVNLVIVLRQKENGSPFDVEISRGNVLEFLHARLEGILVLISRLGGIVLSVFRAGDPMHLLR